MAKFYFWHFIFQTLDNQLSNKEVIIINNFNSSAFFVLARFKIFSISVFFHKIKKLYLPVHLWFSLFYYRSSEKNFPTGPLPINFSFFSIVKYVVQMILVLLPNYLCHQKNLVIFCIFCTNTTKEPDLTSFLNISNFIILWKILLYQIYYGFLKSGLSVPNFNIASE